MRIVEERVKPERSSWAVIATPIRKALVALRPLHAVPCSKPVRGLERVLVISRVGQAAAFAFLPAGMVYSEQTIVFADELYFAVQPPPIPPPRSLGPLLRVVYEGRMRYTPSDCFETFPFPPNFETDPSLEFAGQAYYEFRAALMIRNNEGLTKTYNRFHDPDERSPDILKLRELHAAMDRAVLDAYGWTDLKPTCEFLLDYEEDEDEDESGGGRRRKKPWRYRWPDDFRDEVLARLLELNRQRAEEERLSGAAAEGTASPKRARKVTRRKPSDQPEMF